ncbi:MAG: NAD-binding protein [bacterium]|nr:NAD-binding protein [bacterium]
MGTLRRRLVVASGLLILVLLIGVTGYMVLEGWDFLDSIYMTVISLTTVGYGETRALSGKGRVFTMFLLLSGMGILAYGIGTFTAFLVEGHLSNFLRIRNMLNRINRLQGHFILCGFEDEAHYVLEEFIKTQTPVVVVAKDIEKLEKNFPGREILYIEGDPTKEQFLKMANIENAKGLITALNTDSENLLVVLSARELSPQLRIISGVFDRDNLHKFQRVGANATVMATFIGGLRMASEAIRPTVVSFLDTMLRETDITLRIEEVKVPGEWEHVGKTLREIHFPAHTDLVIVAVKPLDSAKHVYNPKSNYVVNEGDILIVIGALDQIFALRKFLGYQIEQEGEGEESRDSVTAK